MWHFFDFIWLSSQIFDNQSMKPFTQTHNMNADLLTVNEEHEGMMKVISIIFCIILGVIDLMEHNLFRH